MAERYQQFLGTKPGIFVELIDDSSSPYLVKSEDGFEFTISAEDFKNYYRKEGDGTPQRWNHLITDLERGMVDSGRMAQVLEIVHSFSASLGDYDKARALLRDAVGLLTDRTPPHAKDLRARLSDLGWDAEKFSDRELIGLQEIPEEVRTLLLSDACAVIPFVDVPSDAAAGKNGMEPPAGRPGRGAPRPIAAKGARKDTSAKRSQARMKNVELSLEKDILTVTVDLSQEFGPSKSGKTIIVASTQGNKTLPGREEKIGLNVYKQEGKKPAKGRQKEFKNVLMSVEEDLLRIEVDLSKEFGPSKSGQTTIIASSEGNRLVYGREEKIGLNVYRKNE